MADPIRSAVSNHQASNVLINRNTTGGTEIGSGVQHGPIPARWVLASDELGLSVRAPHEVRSVSESLNPNTTSFGGVMDAEQSTMRTPSGARSIAVSAQWRARHSNDDIRPEAETLRTLTNINPQLGRAPLVTLQWSDLSVTGWIDAISIDWVDGVFDTPPYLPQAFMVRLSVVRAQARVMDRTNRFERFTRYRRLGAGESLESVAWRTYRDPDMGNVLRRNNPTLAFTGEAPGDVVRIYEPASSIIRGGDPRPQSPALGGNVAAILQQFAEERLAHSGPGLVALEGELGL